MYCAKRCARSAKRNKFSATHHRFEFCVVRPSD
jgi:hypothetical protein